MKVFRAAALACLVFCSTDLLAAPPTPPVDFSHVLIDSISIRNIPAESAVEIIKEKARSASGGLIELNFVFLPGSANRAVTLELANVPLPQALSYFGEVAGLKHRMNGSVVEFRPVSGAKLPARGMAPARPPEPPPRPLPPSSTNQTTDVAAVEAGSSGRAPFASISVDVISECLTEITLGSRGHHTRKSESQKQVLFQDVTGKYADTFLKAVQELNSAFGYEKLTPQFTTRDETKDQAFTLLVGPRTEARKFLREATSQSVSPDGKWQAYYWWDSAREMSKAAIAICTEEITPHSAKHYIRSTLLHALGYPGKTRRFQGIFQSYRSRFPDAKAIATHDSEGAAFLSDWDVALLRFSDRFLESDASRTNIRKIVAQHWPQFAAELDKTMKK